MDSCLDLIMAGEMMREQTTWADVQAECWEAGIAQRQAAYWARRDREASSC
jgi:hypothetical protein